MVGGRRDTLVIPAVRLYLLDPATGKKRDVRRFHYDEAPSGVAFEYKGLLIVGGTAYERSRLDGRAACRQAAKQLAHRLAAEHQLTHVVYRNASRVPRNPRKERRGVQRGHPQSEPGAGVTQVEVFPPRRPGPPFRRPPARSHAPF